MTMMQTRRRFLATLSLAGAAGVVRRRGPGGGGRRPKRPRCVCHAQDRRCATRRNIVVEDLLRAEGFTDIRYVPGRRARRSTRRSRAAGWTSV